MAAELPSINAMTRDCLLEIDCRLKAEKRREFAQSASWLMQPEPEGHVRTVIFEDRDEPDHILWVEEWRNRPSLDRYLETEAFLALIGGLRTLGNVLDCRVVELTDSRLGHAGALARNLEGRRVTQDQPGEKQKAK